MFGITKKKPAGQIKYFGLSDWWSATFTKDEQKKIVSIFQPPGGSGNNLTEGDITFSSGSATSLLSGLSGWFKNEQDRTIAYRMLEKAEALSSKASTLDRHFMYQSKIETYYRFRATDSFALARAMEGCKQQIAMSAEAAKAFRKEYGDRILPMHVGYQQLVIIKEKEGQLDEAIKISEQALKEGWGGDWERRIERYKKKIKKAS